MITTVNTVNVSFQKKERLNEQGECSCPRIDIQNNIDIVIFANAQGLVTYVNSAITILLGYTSEEVVGSPLSLFVHPDELCLLQQVSENIKRSPDRSIRTQFRFRSKDGSWRWFEGSSTNLLHVPGIAAILHSYHDITQEKLKSECKRNEPDHFVQFYENDAFLINSLSNFVGTGLKAGDACIVIATETHRDSLEELLKGDGLEIDTACTRGQYISIDADAIQPMFMVDGLPDPAQCVEILGNLITQAARCGRQVRIFGEIVVLLWEKGNRDGAIRLEELWNDLSKTHSFSLFCAYPIHLFGRENSETAFTEVCNLHSHVIPTESYTQLPSRDEQLRTICQLQQKAQILPIETVKRKDAEKQLHLTEMRYRCPFEASRDGILLVDPFTYTIIDANPFMEELLGCTYEQLLGQNLWQIGLLNDQEKQLEYISFLQEKRDNQYKTVQLQTREGKDCYVEFVSTLYQLNGRKVIQCNIRDITERKKAEESLLHLAAIVESSEDAIIGKNMNGLITSWNKAAERMYGYRAEEIIGKPISLLTPLGQEDEMREIMETLRQGQKVAPYETTRMHKDGTLIDVSLSTSPIKNALGQVTGASSIARDITAQKQLERRTLTIVNALLSIETMTQENRNARQIAQELGIFIHTVLQSTYTGIVTFEPQTDIQHPLVKIGLSTEQLDLFWKTCPGTHLIDVLGNENAFTRLQAGECVQIDLTCCPGWEQHKAFGFRSYFLVPMRLGDELIGMLTIGHEAADHVYSVAESTLAQATAKLATLVLERERLNQEQVEGQAREFALRESNRRMDEFIGIVSHELRTPLTSLIGTTQMCAKSLERLAYTPDLSEEVSARKSKQMATMLTQAEQQLWRLNRLVDDLLDISRIQAGKLPLTLDFCDLVLLISRAVEEQREMHPTRSILLTLPTDSISVLADGDRIGQVITNYLTNALKYAVKDRPISVSLTIQKKWAVVSVQDEGPGLAPTELERIWERFYRVPGIKERGGSRIGLGLGLHICRNIIEQHQGHIGVQSQPGEGSIFWFALPLAESAS